VPITTIFRRKEQKKKWFAEMLIQGDEKITSDLSQHIIIQDAAMPNRERLSSFF
jgi:transposase